MPFLSPNQQCQSTERNAKQTCVAYVVADRRGMNIFQADAGDAPLREPGTISVTFTPRVFPTPTRESLAPDEEAVRERILPLPEAPAPRRQRGQ